jgi:hypothetical protein
VGGGSKSEILNQFTADACQRSVVAGPVEATAMGNLLVQVRASGELSSLAEMRQVVRRSSEVSSCHPRKTSLWTEAFGRLTELWTSTEDVTQYERQGCGAPQPKLPRLRPQRGQKRRKPGRLSCRLARQGVARIQQIRFNIIR